MLRDMLEKQELLIVLDDGRHEYTHPFIAPNKALITTAAALHRLNVPNDTTVRQLQNFSVSEVFCFFCLRCSYFVSTCFKLCMLKDCIIRRISYLLKCQRHWPKTDLSMRKYTNTIKKVSSETLLVLHEIMLNVKSNISSIREVSF